MRNRRRELGEVVDCPGPYLVPYRVHSGNLHLAEVAEEIAFRTYAHGHVVVVVEVCDVGEAVLLAPFRLLSEEVHGEQIRPYVPVVGSESLFRHAAHRREQACEHGRGVIAFSGLELPDHVGRPWRVGEVGLVASETQHCLSELAANVFLVLLVGPVEELAHRCGVEVVTQGVGGVLAPVGIVDGPGLAGAEVGSCHEDVPGAVARLEADRAVDDGHHAARRTAAAERDGAYGPRIDLVSCH